MIKKLLVSINLFLGFCIGLHSQTVSTLAGQQYTGNGKYSGFRIQTNIISIGLVETPVI
jgi:hypothetical protein